VPLDKAWPLGKIVAWKFVEVYALFHSTTVEAHTVGENGRNERVAFNGEIGL
jgi:hypothetical protein